MTRGNLVKGIATALLALLTFTAGRLYEQHQICKFEVVQSVQKLRAHQSGDQTDLENRLTVAVLGYSEMVQSPMKGMLWNARNRTSDPAGVKDALSFAATLWHASAP